MIEIELGERMQMLALAILDLTDLQEVAGIKILGKLHHAETLKALMQVWHHRVLPTIQE